MAYLTDKEKRILFSALSREKKVCKQVDKDCCREPYEETLQSVVESLERKFYYDRMEKEIRNATITEFAERMKRKILEEIDEVSESQRNYEVGSEMSITCSHIMGSLRDVHHRVIDEIAEEMRGAE